MRPPAMASWQCGRLCRDDRQCVGPAASVEAIGSGAAPTADQQPRASPLVDAWCSDRADVTLGSCSRWGPAQPGHGTMHRHSNTRQRDRAAAAHLLVTLRCLPRRKGGAGAPNAGESSRYCRAAVGDAQRRSMDGARAISSCCGRTFSQAVLYERLHHIVRSWACLTVVA